MRIGSSKCRPNARADAFVFLARSVCPSWARTAARRSGGQLLPCLGGRGKPATLVQRLARATSFNGRVRLVNGGSRPVLCLGAARWNHSSAISLQVMLLGGRPTHHHLRAAAVENSVPFPASRDDSETVLLVVSPLEHCGAVRRPPSSHPRAAFRPPRWRLASAEADHSGLSV